MVPVLRFGSRSCTRDVGITRRAATRSSRFRIAPPAACRGILSGRMCRCLGTSAEDALTNVTVGGRGRRAGAAARRSTRRSQPAPPTPNATVPDPTAKEATSLAHSRAGVPNGEQVIRGGTHFDFDWIPNPGSSSGRHCAAPMRSPVHDRLVRQVRQGRPQRRCPAADRQVAPRRPGGRRRPERGRQHVLLLLPLKARLPDRRRPPGRPREPAGRLQGAVRPGRLRRLV
jgi:hypothetical protein